MKKSIVISGVLTLALAVFTSGCGIFETNGEDNGPYYRPLNKADDGSNGADKNGSGGPGAGDADIKSGDNGGLNDATQPTEYTEGSGLNNYDGFGTPIPGVTFNPVYFGFDQFAVGSAELN